MLDDLKYIHQRDGQDALGVAEKQWQQYGHQFEVSWEDDGWKPGSVVVAGMGGSGLAATALGVVPGLGLPYEVIRGYDLPKHVNSATLLICVSYSGNTEETLSVLNQALAKDQRPRIACIGEGGKIQELAQANGLSFIQLPPGYQPRVTFGYQYAALSKLLARAGVLEGLSAKLGPAAEVVKQAVAQWRPDVATKDNLAKRIALELAGKSPVIYGGPKMFPAAYKWKISFNENAKNVAWCGQFPEFNHNEFIGWTSHPVDKTYGVIELRSQFEHPQILKRFEVSDRLLSGRWPQPIVVDIPKGASELEDLLWVIALGDFVSIYLALLNGVNPTPVDLVEKFKTELST